VIPRRVVITGIGAVTPIGEGRVAMWDAVRRGVCAIGPVTRFDASVFRSRMAAEVTGFDPLRYVSHRRARRLDRFSAFAVAAALQAIDDACLPRTDVSGARTAVYLGSALGGIAYAEEQHTHFAKAGPRGVDPFLALSVFGGAASSNIAMELGINGPCVGNANSCASGAIAIGEAFRAIQTGEIDRALAGGAEAPLAPLTFGSFSLIKAMSTCNDSAQRACCPFDVERSGFVMAEASSVLVLEELDAARRRGAHIYAEVLGFGHTNDAFHITAPRPDGSQAARAIRLALAAAQIRPHQVGYVNAHASSSPLNDLSEAKALHEALGTWSLNVPVSGTKGHYGHPLGASGALEAALCALAIEQEWLPPTLNLCHQDPGIDLRCITGPGMQKRVDFALSNAFGFGGINAVLVFGRVTS
jgi:3-oxoacyl-[acyl-carrier-protein] synthase II